jgi:LmbE family N-acetylglucosaminyl deacetylase
VRRAAVGVVLSLVGIAALRLTACSEHHTAGDAALEPPPASPVLVLAAHEDDELAMVARIHRRISQGHPVHVAWSTDNTFLGDSSVRQAEARCAMGALDIPTSQLHFVGADLHLDSWASILAALPSVARSVDQLLREIAPGEIYVVSWEGGNLEHDATNLALAAALTSSGSKATVYEFPLYNQGSKHFPWFQVLRFAGPEDHETYSDVPTWDEWRRFGRALHCYQTQSGIWWSVLADANLRLLSEGFAFRSLPTHDFTRPPHEGLLNYEGNRVHRTLPRWIQSALEPYLGREQGATFERMSTAAISLCGVDQSACRRAN